LERETNGLALAEALRSYARQANDDRLEKMAMKIKARAARRAGEIFNELEGQNEQSEGKAGRPKNNQSSASPITKSLTRKEAAKGAGFSDDQRKQAQQVAAVPKREFEKAVESGNPPTVTALGLRLFDSSTAHLTQASLSPKKAGEGIMKWFFATALALYLVATEAQAYSCNEHYHRNVDGKIVHSPSCGRPSEGHETAICRDGSHSYSMHHRGTCSHHGGVARWE
jgi:Protein of unknown function (DUF3761)